MARTTLKEQTELVESLQEQTDSLFTEHREEIDSIKEVQTRAETLLEKVEKRQGNIEQLVYLGFLIIAFTALGIAIAFLNLVVDVYNTKTINSFF